MLRKFNVSPWLSRDLVLDSLPVVVEVSRPRQGPFVAVDQRHHDALLVLQPRAVRFAGGSATMEESVVTAVRDCGADEEAIPSLRLTLQRSELLGGTG